MKYLTAIKLENYLHNWYDNRKKSTQGTQHPLINDITLTTSEIRDIALSLISQFKED